MKYHVIRRAVATAALYFGTSAAASAQCPPLNCSDTISDVAALQCRLDQGGTITLQADGCSQGYYIDGTLSLWQNGTTLTSTSAFGNRALLFAVPGLRAPMLKVASGVLNYTISNIWLWGNRFNRTNPDCTGNHTSVNLWLNGSGWVLDNIASDAAPCQTSTVVFSSNSNFEIRNSWFTRNGWSEPELGGACSATRCWADGLTVHGCFGGWIHHNNFVDNTDVDLIVGGGNCTVHDNTIRHTNSYGQAGLMAAVFTGGNGNHAGSTYGPRNNVSSGLDKLAFGIMVGQHPWNVQTNLTNAGSVSNNSASGAVINLAVEGIASGAAGTVSGNTMSGAQGSNGFGNCTISSNYTAYQPHAGSASLQAGWLPLQFDSNTGCILR